MGEARQVSGKPAQGFCDGACPAPHVGGLWCGSVVVGLEADVRTVVFTLRQVEEFESKGAT